MTSGFEIRAAEANRWWQRNDVLGALLNRLMLVFILMPIALVFIQYYTLSFVVFAFLVPYGFLLRYLAVRAVRSYLVEHPDALEEFATQGIISEAVC